MKKIRNIAIIAHVDHGKTTLVNQLLRSSDTFRTNEILQDRAMDSNDLEREKGITILAKTTAIKYQDYQINILDTPGHADFGGEVERIMCMVDGCLLLVDAWEGTMPQTRFVLKKALEAKIKPIVIVNKMDKANIEPKKIVDQILELFISLNAPSEFLDFKVIYISALKGTSSFDSDPSTQTIGMKKVLDTIINEIPAPKVVDGPFKWQATLLDHNNFVGRLGVGVIKRGHVKVNDYVVALRSDGTKTKFKILKLFGYLGLKRIEIQEAQAGEIVAIAGLNDLNIGETLCDPQFLEAEKPLKIEEPTLQMFLAANTSPFVGQDGTFVTARLLEERLLLETQKDVALKVKRITNQDTWMVVGRGELHLSILMEKMRRDGYEFEVSKPIPIIKEINGQKYEPYEDVYIEVSSEYQGTIIETLGNRGAELISMTENNNLIRFNYVISSRGLLGLTTLFLTLTRGYGVLAHSYKEYRPLSNKKIPERSLGVLVATATGVATSYAIEKIENHGTVFIKPGTNCYAGMIIGEHCYNSDLNVNVTLEKHKTNVRASKDNSILLKEPRKMSLEDCLDYINLDELVEITPLNLRMRKKILDANKRKQNKR